MAEAGGALVGVVGAGRRLARAESVSGVARMPELLAPGDLVGTPQSVTSHRRLRPPPPPRCLHSQGQLKRLPPRAVLAASTRSLRAGSTTLLAPRPSLPPPPRRRLCTPLPRPSLCPLGMTVVTAQAAPGSTSVTSVASVSEHTFHVEHRSGGQGVEREILLLILSAAAHSSVSAGARAHSGPNATHG